MENDFVLKKIMKTGKVTLAIMLPKKFLDKLDLKHKSLLKVSLSEEDSKIILEKFENDLRDY